MQSRLTSPEILSASSEMPLPRQRWTGLAVLLVVAVSAGFSPSAVAWALVPQVEQAWVGMARESCPERSAVRQLQDALAKAVRKIFGSDADEGSFGQRVSIAPARLVGDVAGRSVRGTTGVDVFAFCDRRSDDPGLLALPPPLV